MIPKIDDIYKGLIATKIFTYKGKDFKVVEVEDEPEPTPTSVLVPPEPEDEVDSKFKMPSELRKILKPDPRIAGGKGASKLSKELLYDKDTEVIGTILPKPSTWFDRKIANIFKDNATKRIVGNKLSGNVDFEKLYRIATTSKVFCKPDDISKKQYNVLLLVDTSGSMCGSKFNVATTTAMALVRDMQKLVSLEVMAFCGKTITCKKFDELIPVTELKNKIYEPMDDNLRRYGGDNHDHVALKIATKSLMKRTGRKILIVLSDGGPCCSGHNDECDTYCKGRLREGLKQQVSITERLGITILSIGIIDESVRYYYKHYTILDKLDNMYTEIAKYMDRYIKRGG